MLSVTEYNTIYACRTAKEVWDKLMIMHEGTTQVKKSKISLLMHQYEFFNVSQMHERFLVITNVLKCLGKEICNEDRVYKIIHGMPLSWKSKCA